ncbi:hypothetical protein GGS20DRAFT_555634 [Poronia punctata]|nr:hypothetical protein GGS20DRAFT_555634 [Poronia punctata]
MARGPKTVVARGQRADVDGRDPTQMLHDLELKHHTNAAESVFVAKDENMRRLKLRILLLRDENTKLREQVDQNDALNAKILARCDDLNAQLKAKMAMVDAHESLQRKHEREYANLKAELQSMNDLNENSANLLAEKLALSRELANLKPEIEHLRSQVNHEQATLAEKLALERQVNSLEVELANEKKARKRSMESRQSNDRVEDELRKKLREAEKKLTAETAERERLEDQLQQRIKTQAIFLEEQDNIRQTEADLRKAVNELQRQLREEIQEKENINEELHNALRTVKKLQAQKTSDSADEGLGAELEKSQQRLAELQQKHARAKQEHQTTVDELEGRNGHLERKLEKARTKFRELQEELRTAQTELHKAQQQRAQARSSVPEEGGKLATKAQASRKKRAMETSAGDFTSIEIQTPSADAAMKSRKLMMKKPILERSLVGEKSEFSITPLLNRKNTSMSDDASKVDDEVLEDSILGSRQVPEPDREPSETLLSQNEPTADDAPEAESAGAAEPEREKPAAKVPKARGRPKKIMEDASSAKHNAVAQKVPKKILKTKPSLPKVAKPTENEEAETSEVANKEPAERTTTVKFNLADAQDESNASGLVGDQPKKKKRKVLGSTKTLFDNDDGEETPVVRKPAKMQLGMKRIKAPLGGQRNAFAGATSFSPLKRDRRGVGASFLA